MYRRECGQQFASLGLPIEVGVELPSEVVRRIVEAHLLVDRVNLLDILGLELEIACKVVLDPALGLALGQHRSSVGDTPSQRHLSTRLSVLLSNLRQSWVLDQLSEILALAVDWVLVTEG